jgi:hypothetical protein
MAPKFVEWPAEIRDLVYEAYFSDTYFILDDIRPLAIKTHRDFYTRGQAPPLLLSCKQIYGEAQPVFLRRLISSGRRPDFCSKPG